MFEALITKVLNKVLGDFIENLQPHQLDISLLKGDVNLVDMKLRADLFASLPLPFALVFGQIGRIYIRIPPLWRIQSEALVIEISDILAIIRPKHVKEWSEEVEVREYQEKQRKRLEQQELIQENAKDAVDYLTQQASATDQDSATPQSQESKIDQLVDKIIDNLQIRIRNIYVRYEDSYSSPHSGQFAIGILLQELVTHTTDREWRHMVMQEASQEFTHKLLKLTNFSVFLDFHDQYQQSPPVQSIVPEDYPDFKDVIQKEFRNPHNYILDSFSMEARLLLNKKPERNNRAKYAADVILGGQYYQALGKGIGLTVHSPQIVRITKLIEYIGFFSDFQQGATQDFEDRILDQDTANNYIQLYTEFKELSQDTFFMRETSTISKQVNLKVHIQQLKLKLNEIESRYSADKIIMLRSFALKLIQQREEENLYKGQIVKQVQDKRSQLIKWGGLFTSRDEEIEHDKEIQLFQKKLEKSLHSKVLHQKAELDLELTRLTEELSQNTSHIGKLPTEQQSPAEETTKDQSNDFLKLDLKVTIPIFKLALINEYAHPVLEIKILKQVSLVQIGSKFQLFEFSMNALIAKDLWTKASIEFYNIIETRDIDNEGEVSPDLLEEDIHPSKITEETDKRALVISLESQSNDQIPTKLSISSERTLFIIPVFPVINEAIRTLSNAFKSEEIDMNYYHEAATEKALEFMNKGKQLLNSIKKGDYEHSAINMSVHLFAPMILVPEDYFDVKKPCILIDSGIISLKSDLIPPEHFKKGKNLKLVTSASTLYDRYECGFSDFQINLLPHGLPQGGISSISRGCGTQIIKKLNIHLEFLNCLEPMHPLYPTLEMVFIVQNFEILASFNAFYTVMRIQERFVDTIINDEELIFQKPQQKGGVAQVIQGEESWEKYREEARKRTTLKRAETLEQAQRISKAMSGFEQTSVTMKEENKTEIEANEAGTDTSFRMYFSVEKFQVIIYHDVKSERFRNQTTMENLFDVLMLNLGVEIDLDRKGDIHVNTNIYKLTIEDIHKKSKLAHQFRMVLSCQVPDLPIQYLGRRYKYLEVGIMKKSLLSIIDAEYLSRNQILNELRPQFNIPSNIEHQVDVRISLLRATHEISVKVVISDIKLIFTLPTTSKIQQILKELDRTFDKLDTERLKDRKAKLKIYEYVILHCLCTKTIVSSSNKEQEFLIRTFSNFARDNKLDPRINQSEIRDGIQRLKTIWDMRCVQKEEEAQAKKKGTQNSLARKSSLAKVLERKEIVKTKLKVTANMKSFQVWIPLYADSENSQLLQLSLVSEFSLIKNAIQENTINIELDEIVDEDVHESRSQMGFAVNQLTVQVVQCKDLIEQISPRVSPRKFSKSSISEEESSDSGDEFDPLMQSVKRRQMIIPPTRMSVKIQGQTNFKPEERGKSDIKLHVDPLAIQIGFKHIDFFNIIMMQVNNTLAIFDEQNAEESQFGTDKMGSPRKINSPSKMREEIKESEVKIKKALQIEEQKESKFGRYNPSEIFNPKDINEIKVRLDSLTVSLNDDSSNQNIPLILAELKNITANLKSAEYKDDAGSFILKKLGLWQTLHPTSMPHFDLKSTVFMQMSYYNPRSLSFEPLLEKWDFGLDILQIAHYTQQKISFHSENSFNLNLTFGMALTLRKILERLDKSFKHADVMRKVEEGWAVSADEFEMTLDWRTKMLEEQDDEENRGNVRKHQEVCEPGFIFLNYMGLDVKFALHDEFSDDNLESSIFNVEYDFRRQSIHQRSTNMGDRRKIPYLTLSANSSEILQKSYGELIELQNETLKFRSGGLMIEQLEDDPLRLDFKFRGLSKIQAVPIENIGVFSYQAKITDLLSSHQIPKKSIFRSPLRGGNDNQMTCGIIINITMEGNQKKIQLESQVMIRNNTRTPIKIFVKTPLQLDQDLRKDQIADINPETQFKVPLHWLISDTKLSMYMTTIQGNQLLFKNLAKTFTASREIARISEKHSKIVKLNFDHYASLDIQGYSCYPKSTQQINPPQYVISFNYPLMISNYNFHPLQVNASSHLEEQPVARMAPKETSYIDTLDLVTAHMNLQWIIHESSIDKYTLQTHHFDVAQRTLWQSQGGNLEKFKNQTGKNKIKLLMEVRRKVHHTQLSNETSDQENPLENFELRERIMDFSCSYQVMVYPKYMVVNKTSIQLQSEKQTFEPYSNNYFNINHDKASFRVPGYRYSDSLNINTVGISGILAMDIDSKEHVSIERILPGKEYIPQRLDCGLSISTATAPFNKTFIISITPRYQLINHLNVPLVVKQKNRINQILFKGQSMIYFFESKKERFIMIREPTNEELSASKLQEDLANDLNWSSPFSIDDVEDFQVSYPKNQNFTSYFREQLQSKWYEPNHKNDFQRFVRILVKTQNEATIQIMFTNPQNPEYEIINRSSYDLIFGQAENDTILKQIQKLKLQEQNFEELVVAKKLFNLPHQTQIPFAWVQRVQSNRVIGLKLGNTQQLLEIDLEKAVPPAQIVSRDADLRLAVEVKVSGYSKKLIFSNISDAVLQIEGQNKLGSLFLQNLLKKLIWHKQSIKFKLRGIGLSFIDETPQELLYFTFHGLKVSFYQWLETRNTGETSEDWSYEACHFDLNSKIRGSLKHLQLDNMISQTMPVILIPSKPLKKNEKDGHMMMEERIQRQMDEEIKEVEPQTSSHKAQEDLSPPFIQFIVSYAESTDEQNSSFRLRTMQFAMQEFIFQIDTSIFNSNLKFVMELIETFSESSQNKVIRATPESFHKFRNIKREEVCEDLDAQQVGLQLAPDNGENEKTMLANKMFIELIHLGAIKAIITFRLEKRAVELDIADPAKGFGAANLFYTLFAAVASISQSPITFKELILIDTFATQDSLTNQIVMNYIRQGIMQFYKLIASSDIIGNPLGLVNKLGTGVYEFVSEPSKGLLKGTDEFVGGVGKGVQSLVSNVISGSFESMSKITGSLYTVVKNVSGEKNTQIRRTEHIGEGIYYGVKGGVKELVQGVTGIVTKPIQKTREEGAKGFFKGLGSGLVGAIAAPVTATLRAGTSMTQGVAASATSLGMIGKKVVDTQSTQSRFRPPRYISAKGIMQEYDEDLALVRQILVTKYFGQYGGDSIKFYSLLPLTKKSGIIKNIDPSSSILIITETMLLYFRLETNDKKRGSAHRIFKTRLRKIQSCELFKVHLLGPQTTKRRTTQSGMSIYHIVLTCYSQVNGQKKFTLVSNDYSKFEKIYKLLSVLPFCEAVNRVKKQRNSKILGLVEKQKRAGSSLF